MNALLDTGPWVALIDKSEASHNTCVEWFRDYRGRLFSTEAVLTEVLYLLDFSIEAQSAAIDFIIESVAEIVPSSIETIRKCKELMQKYSDLPMDYADATLVCLASDLGVMDIVTLDRRDFRIYRAGARRFNIIP